VPARRSTLPPNHDGSPGDRRLWFPPAAAGLGKIVSVSATRFPDDGARAVAATAALGGATAFGGVVALSTWPLAAACATAIGVLLGTGALVVRAPSSFTTWVGEGGIALVRRRPMEPAESSVLLFRDVSALERHVFTNGRWQRVEDCWTVAGAQRPVLVIAAEVEAGGDVDPDAARFDALPAWHPHHFARAARHAYARWRAHGVSRRG